MIRETSPAQVRIALLIGAEIALLDLREEDPFAKGHPLFAANLPLSRLEIEVLDRIPRPDTKIVVFDDGEGLTPLGVARLGELGYSDVSVLTGGLEGWRRAGYELFADVNSASKAFGELVEARRRTPSLPASDAKRLIDTERNLVVLDARRFDEYQTMSIPRGVSVPGAELVLRAREIAPDPTTTIIVNCAGRTRSIIGAQSLINAGVPNPVFALRNGAIGWTLAGQTLERGRDARFPEVGPEREAEARAAAREVAYHAGVRRIDASGLDALVRDTGRTLYRFDVRTPEEYAAGHFAGFRSAPGGQLVQETDVFAPVRGARMVLFDDLGARADMSASWLAQMNWEVYVLEGVWQSGLVQGPWAPARPPAPAAEMMSAHALAQALAASEAAVVDIGPSPAFRRGHIPGAWFATRARLLHQLGGLPQDRMVVITSPDGVLARFAAAETSQSCGRQVLALEGGTEAWSTAGRPLESGFQHALSPADDVYRRPYEGTDHAAEAMQAYLDWEFGLVEQLRRDGTHGFRVI